MGFFEIFVVGLAALMLAEWLSRPLRFWLWRRRQPPVVAMEWTGTIPRFPAKPGAIIYNAVRRDGSIDIEVIERALKGLKDT